MRSLAFRDLRFRRLGDMIVGKATAHVLATVTTLNPFSATVTAPAGFAFVAGPITINIFAKDGTFGVAGSVAGTITSGGVVTENVAGQVELSVQNAGYADGDPVDVYVDGAETVVDSAPIHIFVLAGQSNAVGQAPDDGGAAFPVGTRHFNVSDTWQDIGSRVYHSQSPSQTETPDPAATFGFARGFAIAYAAANPGVKLYFIGAAKGSTSFSQNNWNPGNAVYNASVARVNAALAAVPSGILKGVLWHQGESDKILNAEAAYGSALTTMIPAYRAAITGGTDVPFVVAGPFIRGGAYGETIQLVDQAMPNMIAYTGYADSSSPSEVVVLGDTLHANAASNRTFGPQYIKGLAEAQANASIAPSGGGITVGTAAQYALASSTSQTLAGVALGTAATDRIICAAVHYRNGSFSQRVLQMRIGGIDMIRMGTPEVLGVQCNTALFYAKIPTGTTASLEIVMDVAPSANQFGVSILPVYGAQMHLARVNGFNHGRDTGTSVASIATTVDVQAGDLIFAAAGSINAGSNVGTFATGTTLSGQFGSTFAAHLGYEIAAADATAKSVSCSFSTNTQKPTISAMCLRRA